MSKFLTWQKIIRRLEKLIYKLSLLLKILKNLRVHYMVDHCKKMITKKSQFYERHDSLFDFLSDF